MTFTRRGTACLAAALAALALALAGCGSGSSTTSAQPGDGDGWQQEVAAFSGKVSPLAVPERLPAGLDNAKGLTMEGQGAVTFYNPGEPLVTVCSGDLDRCRKVLGTSVEIRTGTADGANYVIALGRSENPDSTPRLSPRLDSFWATVPLTTSQPDWLARTATS